MEPYDLLEIIKSNPKDFISSIGQLLLGLGIFGNMILSWKNGRKITEVHKTADKAVVTAQTAVGNAASQLQDVKATTLQVRDEVITAIKNGNGKNGNGHK